MIDGDNFINRIKKNKGLFCFQLSWKITFKIILPKKMSQHNKFSVLDILFLIKFREGKLLFKHEVEPWSPFDIRLQWDICIYEKLSAKFLEVEHSLAGKVNLKSYDFDL